MYGKIGFQCIKCKHMHFYNSKIGQKHERYNKEWV